MTQTKKDSSELKSLHEVRDSSDFFTFANAIVEQFEKSLNDQASKKKLKLQGDGSCHELVLKSAVKKNILNEANSRSDDEYHFGVASIMLEKTKLALSERNQNLVLERLMILATVLDRAMGAMLKIIDAEIKKQRSAQATKGATSMLAKSPKQQAKKEVYEYWKKWKALGNDYMYPSKAAFARDMFEKFDALENPTVIERWCRRWEKEHSAC